MARQRKSGKKVKKNIPSGIVHIKATFNNTIVNITDPNGNTSWQDSPLLCAARRGECCVLDGVHRLAPGTLYSTVQRLLCDREALWTCLTRPARAN